MNDLIAEIAGRLSGIEGMAAVALGGSYARGTQRPESDIDLGLYYREVAPFSIQDIKGVAEEISDEPRPVVTDFGRWGPWVNGGAWLTVKGQRVDFLYRNLDKIERVMEECRRGQFQSDYYQQATYGFHSYIYLGELNVCKALHDPQKVLDRLKERLYPYPSLLKKAIVDTFLWSLEIDLAQGKDFAAKGDVYNATGCFARCAPALVQVVYALNERYFLTDKAALLEIESFAVKPEGLTATLQEVLSRPGSNSGELSESASKLTSVFREAVEICGDLYSRPDFRA